MVDNKLIHSGKRVVVMGMGVSGRAAVRYLLKCDADVSVSDCRLLEELTSTEREFLGHYEVSYEGGEHSSSFLEKAEMIVVSPGIPSDLPVLTEARKQGIPVLGELALAGPAVKVPVVAITGTNGKTTVTSLIGELLRRTGRKVFVGGNIGTPLFDFLSDDKPADVVVLEVSSFQLENSGAFRPDVALMLNVTPDHLDRHGSFGAYADAKARIFLHQERDDYAILCEDDPACRLLMERFPGKQYLSFGYGEVSDARIHGDSVDISWQGQRHTYDLAKTCMGNHIGRLNASAAILAVLSLGCGEKEIEKGIRAFSPPPHRMERVGEFLGVTYIDDSKATNTGAVLSAVAQVDSPIVLIAGGRDKGDDYSLLRDAVAEKVRKLILIGEAAGKIAEQLDGVVPIDHADSLEDAVLLAAKTAEAGYTVLLSPACASFDMFDSYGQRGDVFAAAFHRMSDSNRLAEPEPNG